jgi:hypothetical protein
MRYVAGGGAYVDTGLTDEVTFTASGATEDIEYHVPVNTDYDYEVDAANVTIAVATP